MTTRTQALRYAVRIRVVAKYLAQLLLALAAVSVVPLVAALVLGEAGLAWRQTLVVAVLLAVSVPLARLRVPQPMQANEALVVTALAFLLAPVAMTYPLWDAGLGWLDALFEAVSAITTTGLTTVAEVQRHSAGFLFTRAWIQWFSGLGIVILSLALIIGPGAAARRLASSDNEGADLVGGTRIHARRAIAVYLALTAAGFLLLWLLGAPAWPALLHVLTAVSTAGFSSYDHSLAGFPSWSQAYALMLVSLSGAVSLSVYYRAYLGHWREVGADLQLRGLVVATLLSTVLLGASLALLSHMPWSELLIHAPLLAVSAQSTTGFSSLDIHQLDPVSKIIMVLAMAVGGDVGSTAGGVKLLRLLILVRILQLAVLRTAMPSHAVAEPRLGDQRLRDAEIERALLVIILFVMVALLSWLPFLALGYDPVDALFEIVSAMATTGLSAGIAGAALEPALKGVLCADMLLGRLEIIAVLVLLLPGTWIGKRMETT